MFSVNKSISLSNYSNQIRFYSMNEIESGARNILIKSFYFLLTNNDSIANILKSMPFITCSCSIKYVPFLSLYH